MGNLGWDDDSEVLRTRATEVLRACGIATESYTCLGTHREKGSMVDFRLEDPTIANDLQLKVGALRKSFLADGKKVWLSNKKTSEERKFAKVIHRAHELICQHIQPTRVEKVIVGKQIKIDGRVAAYTYKSQLQWSPASHPLLDSHIRDEIKAYAED